MTEADRTKRLLKALRARYPRAFVWKINDRIRAGIPDVYLKHPGTPGLWVEFKGPKTTVTTLQALEHNRLRLAGDDVLLVRFREDGHAIIDQWTVSAPASPLPEGPEPFLVYLERRWA